MDVKKIAECARDELLKGMALVDVLHRPCTQGACSQSRGRRDDTVTIFVARGGKLGKKYTCRRDAQVHVCLLSVWC